MWRLIPHDVQQVDLVCAFGEMEGSSYVGLVEANSLGGVVQNVMRTITVSRYNGLAEGWLSNFIASFHASPERFESGLVSGRLACRDSVSNRAPSAVWHLDLAQRRLFGGLFQFMSGPMFSLSCLAAACRRRRASSELPVVLSACWAPGLAGDCGARAVSAEAEGFLPLTLLCGVPAFRFLPFRRLVPGLVVFPAGLGAGGCLGWFTWARPCGGLGCLGLLGVFTDGGFPR